MCYGIVCIDILCKYFGHNVHCHGTCTYHIILCVSCVGQWNVPIVSGQCPPPCDTFSLNQLPHNRGILFGGIRNTCADDVYGESYEDLCYNDIYIIALVKNTVVSTCIPYK